MLCYFKSICAHKLVIRHSSCLESAWHVGICVAPISPSQEFEAVVRCGISGYGVGGCGCCDCGRRCVHGSISTASEVGIRFRFFWQNGLELVQMLQFDCGDQLARANAHLLTLALEKGASWLDIRQVQLERRDANALLRQRRSQRFEFGKRNLSKMLVRVQSMYEQPK